MGSPEGARSLLCEYRERGLGYHCDDDQFALEHRGGLGGEVECALRGLRAIESNEDLAEQRVEHPI